MNAIQLVNAEIGTVSSRQDGSVCFRVISAELRPSEAGLVLQYHGKACKVTIQPHEGAPDSLITVTTERESKSPSQRIRAVLFILWKQDGQPGTFDAWYENRMNLIIEKLKEKIDA